MYGLSVAALIGLVAYFVIEQRSHQRRLRTIPVRVLVNGIRGKSSTTRLCAGALRASGNPVVAKTTGTAARFIYPSMREIAISRKAGMANVVEQIGVVARAVTCKPKYLVVECMAVMPELQQLNTEKLIKPGIVIITNVREDHVDEMGPTLADIARSLCRSMPVGGTCITAETQWLHILQEEADKRRCRLIVADGDTVTDAEMAGFDWITFKDNVAVALTLAEILGIPRELALEGMYDAPPDPGVLRVDQCAHNGREFKAVNLFAANDPESTKQNLQLLQQRHLVGGGYSLVINCRPDRVERNGQMGVMAGQLDPHRVYVIGTPTRSASRTVPDRLQPRIVEVEGDGLTGAEILEAIAASMPEEAGHALVLVGNIHGQGEELLHTLERCRSAPAPAAAPRPRVGATQADAPTVVMPRITDARPLGGDGATVILPRYGDPEAPTVVMPRITTNAESTKYMPRIRPNGRHDRQTDRRPA